MEAIPLCDKIEVYIFIYVRLYTTILLCIDVNIYIYIYFYLPFNGGHPVVWQNRSIYIYLCTSIHNDIVVYRRKYIYIYIYTSTYHLIVWTQMKGMHYIRVVSTSIEESGTVTLISQPCCRWSLCLLFSGPSVLLIIWFFMQIWPASDLRPDFHLFLMVREAAIAKPKTCFDHENLF